MRNSSIALAVAGILAASGAQAATDLYVSGASAQRSFWLTDFTATACSTAPVVYKIGGLVDNPDNQAWRCTGKTPTGVPGVPDGDQITIHYSAELGSVYGISLILGGGRPNTRLFVNPDSADCSAPVANASTCTIASYDVNNESYTSANSTAMVSHVADLLVTDLEPALWASAANWPTYNNLNPGSFAVPTKAQLQALTGYVVANGQVFTPIVNTAGPIASLGNISTASLRSIATGLYNVWGDVPEVGGGNGTGIILCRRDQGSGTQVAASVYLTGVECGRSTTGFATQVAPGQLASVVENGTTDKVRKCVNDNPGAIGFTSLGLTSTAGTYTTLRVDGVQANAHNGGAGFYPFAFESFVNNKSASSGASSSAQALAGRLVTVSRRSDSLPVIEAGGLLATSNTGNGMAGSWFASSPKTNFAIPIGGTGNTPSSLAKWGVTATTATVALVSRGGDNCKVAINNNDQ